MEQTIYADILFVINFSMDFLALYIMAFILKMKFVLKRGIVAASIGGVYGVISVVMNMGNIGTVISTALTGIMMCLVLCGYQKLSLLVRQMVVFLISNLIIGGGMTAIYSAFNSFGAAQKLLIYGEIESVEQQMPLALFALGSVVVAVIVLLFGRVLMMRKRCGDLEVYIEYQGKGLKCSGFEDSGNLLTEPFSGLPVMLVSRDMAEELLSEETVRLLAELNVGSKSYPVERIRFMVCNTVAGKKYLGAFKPDVLSVNGVKVAAWVAISDNTSMKALDGCGAIVPSELVHV